MTEPVSIEAILVQSAPLIISSMVGGGLAYFIATRKARKDKDALKESEVTERIRTLEQQVALVNQSIQPISIAFQSLLVKQLTHYHTPDIDELLQKLGPPSTLTDVESIKLAEALEARTRDVDSQIDQSERVAAALLPFVMERVKIENEQIGRNHSLMLVAVPKEDDK
jgi:hypothetical protein